MGLNKTAELMLPASFIPKQIWKKEMQFSVLTRFHYQYGMYWNFNSKGIYAYGTKKKMPHASGVVLCNHKGSILPGTDKQLDYGLPIIYTVLKGYRWTWLTGTDGNVGNVSLSFSCTLLIIVCTHKLKPVKSLKCYRSLTLDLTQVSITQAMKLLKHYLWKIRFLKI